MANFPRGVGAKSFLATPWRFPGALQSWGGSGKGQFRATQNIGRTWEETYPVLDTSLATVRALLEALNRSMRAGVLWDIQHPYLHVLKGAGGGATILVNGAGQTGSTLNVDGATPSIVGWLKQGDIIKVAGTPVVLDVTADVNSNGAGQVAIPISPPIFVGQSPADNAVVTIDPTAITFKAYVSMADFPTMDSSKLLSAGLAIAIREQPQ